MGNKQETAKIPTGDTPTATAAVSDQTVSKPTPSAEAVIDAVPIKPLPPSPRPDETNATVTLPTMSNPQEPPDVGGAIDNYLIKHDRDVRSLLQAFRVTKHIAYLNEALKRFPNDPMVLFHSVVYDTEPTEERKAMLLALQELLPEDAVPCYLLGEQLLQEGNTGAALEQLMAGSLKPHANNYANEMISDTQSFLVSSGVAPADALAQACFDVELRLLTPMRDLTRILHDIHADISEKSPGDASAGTWAILGSRIAQSMQRQMSQTLAEELSSMATESSFLSLLSPDTELVAGGMTVAQRTREIEDFRAMVRSFRLMGDAALSLPSKEKELFFRKVQEEGEFSALLWLNQRAP